MTDEDEYRADERDRRRRVVWCRCGGPDLPGSCPGWRNCPMCDDEPQDDGESE